MDPHLLCCLLAPEFREQRKLLVELAMKTTDQDNGPLLASLRARMERWVPQLQACYPA